MTRRERYLAVLTGGHADAIPWVPKLDHWLAVNGANGTVPLAYRSMCYASDLTRTPSS